MHLLLIFGSQQTEWRLIIDELPQVTQSFRRWPDMVLSAIRMLLIMSDLYVYWIDGGPAVGSTDSGLNLYHMIITCA